MSWYEYLSVSVPCGIVTSGDVGLSNLSLIHITMTFYTMVKASTPIFVLMFAYLFGIERITPQLIVVVLIIAVGEYFTVKGEANFDHIGFLLCLSASVLSGARWTLVQLKLRSLDPPLKTTIATMKLLSPSMFLSLFIVSMYIERPWNVLSHDSMRQTANIIGLGLLGAGLAIAMILCEFYLIMRANAIVLMIGGVLKEMVTIFIGVTYFKDSLNGTNLFGCFIVFLGVAFYKAIHYMDSQHETQNEMVRIATTDMDDSDGNMELSDHDRTKSIDKKPPPPMPNSHSPYNGSKSKYEKIFSFDDSERYDKEETQSDGLLKNLSLHGRTGSGRRYDGVELRRNKSGDGSIVKPLVIGNGDLVENTSEK